MMTTDGNLNTAKLLALLNVSALKSGRKRVYDDAPTSLKLNRRKTIQFAEPEETGSAEVMMEVETVAEISMGSKALVEGSMIELDIPERDDVEEDSSLDPYKLHFGPTPEYLAEAIRSSVDDGSWKLSRQHKGSLGSLEEYSPMGSSSQPASTSTAVLPKLRAAHKKRQEKLSQDSIDWQENLLSTISSYQDLFLSRTFLGNQAHTREVVTLHALNHVMKKRRQVLKNNERLTRASKDPSAEPPIDVQDQGFTRPTILILLPFRSSALRWSNSMFTHTPSPEFQIENHSRFMSEYSLPPGAVDKLESAPAGTYPADHVETFRGNVDDSFRLGVKVTKKSVKLFADFYQCDIILASPLGLRMSIEKEKNFDFLSSIEMLILDQTDAFTMQNWEHVQFVFSHLNQIPKETRDADFSRIKPWYLDGHAGYVRQTIMLSAYETPEIRALFNSTLKNATGKRRTQIRWNPVEVPDGITQTFTQFECSNHRVEPDKRFEYFTSKLLPSVLKSAVQSTNTLIFVPSSFDFIRVQNHLRKTDGVSFAVLSEYSSNQDISRARQAFFSGQKPFLLMSERFHFFRRYKIRGVRNVVFYGPPDHPQFYTEILSYPFLDEGVDASDVSCRVLFSKYDWLRLERIAGTAGAVDLLKQA